MKPATSHPPFTLFSNQENNLFRGNTWKLVIEEVKGAVTMEEHALEKFCPKLVNPIFLWSLALEISSSTWSPLWQRAGDWITVTKMEVFVE